MAELQIPDYMQNKPVDVASLFDLYNTTRANQQAMKMNEMKMAEEQQIAPLRQRYMQSQAAENESTASINQLKAHQQKLALGSNIAKQILGQASKVAQEGTPEFEQAVQQYGNPLRSIMASAFGHENDPSKPIDVNGLKSLAGINIGGDEYEHDFTPQTTPSGDVVFYDKKHPTSAPIFPQQARGMQQPIGNAQQPTQPSNGLVNIFQPTGQGQPTGLSPKSAQLQQEEAVKLSAEAEKLQQQQEAERTKSDLALIQSEPEKLAGISKAAMNLQGLGKNLDKYGEQVKADWLPTDNSIAYNARQVLGSNTVLNDITQANGQIMVDTMRSMKQDSGVSPSQLMNTEKEWERQLAAATGQGTVESRKNAWEKLTRELHQTYNAYEKTRAEAYKRQKKEYKPLINPDILPGAKTIEMDTANMPIGQTGVLNGKKIRVIGQNQIEVID